MTPLSLDALERLLAAIHLRDSQVNGWLDDDALHDCVDALPALIAIARAAQNCPIARGHLVDCASLRRNDQVSEYQQGIVRGCDCGHDALAAALKGVTP